MGHPRCRVGCPRCPFGIVAAAPLHRNATHLRSAGMSVRHTVPGSVLDMGRAEKNWEGRVDLSNIWETSENTWETMIAKGAVKVAIGPNHGFKSPHM